MRINIVAVFVLGVLTAGCTSKSATMPPVAISVTQGSFFTTLSTHFGEYVDIDPNKPLRIKDLDMEFSASGEIRTGWIEAQGSSKRGEVAQFRVRVIDGRWTQEDLPVYGAAHEFIQARQLFDRLDDINWKATLGDLGNPTRIALQLVDASRCLVAVRALEGQNAGNGVSTPTQVELKVCAQ